MSKSLRYSFLLSLSAATDISSKSGGRWVTGGCIAEYASYILSTLRGLVKCNLSEDRTKADRCNISKYYFLRDTNSRDSLFLYSRQMLRKIVFLEQFFGIAFLDSGRRSLLGFQWGLAANSSSGDLHGTYVKQTKAPSLIPFCDKDKGKVLEALILEQVIQFQASWTRYFCRRKVLNRG